MQLYHVCPPVRKIFHSLKLVDCLRVMLATHGLNKVTERGQIHTFILILCQIYVFSPICLCHGRNVMFHKEIE